MTTDAPFLEEVYIKAESISGNYDTFKILVIVCGKERLEVADSNYLDVPFYMDENTISKNGQIQF